MFSSTKNKQSGKNGRNVRVLLVCDLQGAVSVALCQLIRTSTTRPCLSSLSNPVICALLPPHAPTLPLLSVSAVFIFLPKRRSILCVPVTHFLPLYQELIPQRRRSYCHKVLGGVDWKVLLAQDRSDLTEACSKLQNTASYFNVFVLLNFQSRKMYRLFMSAFFTQSKQWWTYEKRDQMVRMC